jgi:ribonuclease HI
MFGTLELNCKKVVYALRGPESRGHIVELHWLPAHQGIPGKKLVDRRAKETVRWRAESKVIKEGWKSWTLSTTYLG